MENMDINPLLLYNVLNTCYWQQERMLFYWSHPPCRISYSFITNRILDLIGLWSESAGFSLVALLNQATVCFIKQVLLGMHPETLSLSFSCGPITDIGIPQFRGNMYVQCLMNVSILLLKPCKLVTVTLPYGNKSHMLTMHSIKR